MSGARRRTRWQIEADADAYHEAGHAVVACLLRVPFRYVTIEPDKKRGSLGRIHLGDVSRPFARVPGKALRARLAGEADVMVGLAGGIAEHVHSGRRSHVGAAGDYRAAVDRVYEHCGPAEAQAYVDWLQARTVAKVTSPGTWCAVRAVAAALMEHRRLSGPQVRRCVRQSYAAGPAERQQVLADLRAFTAVAGKKRKP